MAISSGVRRFLVQSRNEALIFDPQEFNTDWDFAIRAMNRHSFDLMHANATHHPLCSLACQASPSVQSEIPSRARSLMRACPGNAERAGKPPALDAQTPGVVTRKLRVVRNVPTARALPRAEARGHTGRAAMSSAMATSTTPSTAEKPRTLRIP